MNDYIYRDFKMQFPHAADKVVEILESTDTILVVKLNDGRFYEYDVETATLHKLPEDPNNMTEEEWRVEFARKLHSIMWRKGLNQNDLSDMTGISQSAISGYLRGVNSPTVYRLDRIAKALECSILEFIYLGGRYE